MNNLEDNTIIKYITGEATPEEMKVVEDWIRQSAENRKYFQYYQEIWKNTPRASMPDFKEDEALKKVNARLDNKVSEKSKTSFQLLKIAASILLFLSAGYFTYQLILPDDVSNQLVTLSLGNAKKEIKLADGTSVWLNKNSTLSYPREFKGKTREVVLEGEAFFDVVSSPRKPFIVKTGNTSTKVLGTRFNVRASLATGTTEVAVEEGKVALTAENPAEENPTVTLTAGDKGKYIKDKNELTKTKIESMNYNAWQTGILRFQDTNLKTAIEDIGNYYEVDIQVEDKDLMDREFTSTFKERDLNEVLKILELTLDVEVIRTGRSYTIKKK